jgi:small conductance mechanosensitive channel
MSLLQSRFASPERARRRQRPARRRNRPRTRRVSFPRLQHELFPMRVVRSAQARLRHFRYASRLAIGTTGILLLMFGVAEDDGTAAVPRAATVALAASAPAVPPQDTNVDPLHAVEHATDTLRRLANAFYGHLLPRMLIALVVLVLAALLTAGVKALLRRMLGSWQRADAFSALMTVGIWVTALGAALSVLADDARAMVGSVGLFGLALSWALQAPIESFTGWLLNSFRGYYRVGDRIEVGEVFGDVARVDVLNTTVWEAGGPDKPVQAAQPTGALVTFPNSEVLRANIINYTRDFPYVWDEVTIAISNESDFAYAMRLFASVAAYVLGDEMYGAADNYRLLLRRAHLDDEIAGQPKVYVVPTDAYANLAVRYLVRVRERRIWATRLVVALNEAISRPEHRDRVALGYPRAQVDMLSGSRDGSRVDAHGAERL